MSPFGPPDLGRHARLVQLRPVEAAQVLLDGDVMPNDEPALAFAIRKDARITLEDEALVDLMFRALDRGLDAQAVLDLAAAQS